MIKHLRKINTTLARYPRLRTLVIVVLFIVIFIVGLNVFNLVHKKEAGLDVSSYMASSDSGGHSRSELGVDKYKKMYHSKIVQERTAAEVSGQSYVRDALKDGHAIATFNSKSQQLGSQSKIH